MEKYIKYVKYVIILFLVVILGINIAFGKKKKELADAENLMIVAHKEDGLIWGANNLSKDSYLVVCVTCSDEDEDFINVMNETHDEYVLLNYGEESDFYEERNILERDIERYLNLKDWKKIVTHNKEGEYGSDQHEKINTIVTELLEEKDNLYYFAKYYFEEEYYEKNKASYKLNDEEISNKKMLLGMFDDLEYINEFKHIIPYEEFVSYNDWGNDNE